MNSRLSLFFLFLALFLSRFVSNAPVHFPLRREEEVDLILTFIVGALLGAAVTLALAGSP